MSKPSPSSFADLQRRHWAQSAPSHDAWRTEQPQIRALERALLEPVAAMASQGRELLDVGCGEADMLPLVRELGFSGRYVGVDFSADKAAYAQERRQDPQAWFVAADAQSLPFSARSFDTVVARDLLHHVTDRTAALRELLRVTGKRLVVIEPNPFGPLIAATAMARPAERGMLASAPPKLMRLVKEIAPGWRVQRRWAEPQSVTRALLHYQFGFPALGRLRAITWSLEVIEAFCRQLPGALWNYQVLELERSGDSFA